MFADRLLSTFTKKELSIVHWDPFSEGHQDLKVSYCFQLPAVLSLISPPPLADYRSWSEKAYYHIHDRDDPARGSDICRRGVRLRKSYPDPQLLTNSSSLGRSHCKPNRTSAASIPQRMSHPLKAVHLLAIGNVINDLPLFRIF